jgi:hypothetical protein
MNMDFLMILKKTENIIKEFIKIVDSKKVTIKRVRSDTKGLNMYEITLNY